MTGQEDKIKEYVLSIDPPAERDFFSKDVAAKLKEQRLKAEGTVQLVPTLLNYEDFEERLQKAIVEGRIYNPSQYSQVISKLTVLDSADGERVDIQESLVSPTGQRVIMSGRLQQLLDFSSDGYIPSDQTDELIQALQADGVAGPQLDRVTAAMNKYGAIIVQRGVFTLLKGDLEESLGRKLALYVPGATNIPVPKISEETKAVPPMPVPPPVQRPSPILDTTKPSVPKKTIDYTQEELPFSFIEFLKNTDKQFDHVENAVIKDTAFLEFFKFLQSNNKFYQSMTAERMAHELIVRPPLWIKLSEQTQQLVSDIVGRNRALFTNKVAEVAKLVGSSKLDELKASLKQLS